MLDVDRFLYLRGHIIWELELLSTAKNKFVIQKLPSLRDYIPILYPIKKHKQSFNFYAITELLL